MNNLVDLSSIHGFSYFNNIKQIGGGKIFYYTDENNNRTQEVGHILSQLIHHHLATLDFKITGYANFRVDGIEVSLYRDSAGKIFGEIDRRNFIAVDRSSAIAAGNEEDRRQRATAAAAAVDDSGDDATFGPPTVAAAAAGDEEDRRRDTAAAVGNKPLFAIPHSDASAVSTTAVASAPLSKRTFAAEPVRMNVTHQPITSINSILNPDKNPLNPNPLDSNPVIFHKRKYRIIFTNGKEYVCKPAFGQIKRNHILIYFEKIYEDPDDVYSHLLQVLIYYNYDTKDIISIQTLTGEKLVIIPIEKSDDISDYSSDDSSDDSPDKPEIKDDDDPINLESGSGSDESGYSLGGYYSIYFHHCY